MKIVDAIKALNQDFHGGSPFEGVAPAADDEVHGWLSSTEVFDQILSSIQSKIMIEVGTWQGKSAIYSARKMREQTDDFGIICVDTWLGSVEHRQKESWRADLKLKHGYPRIYESFLANVVRAGFQDHIFPIPLPSTQAATYLRPRITQVAMIFIDGGHDYASVKSDLEAYWPMLAPTGVMFGDDYDPQNWPDVVRAANEFFSAQGQQIQVMGNKYIVQKSA